jgi:hypothetical protein
MGGGGGDDDEDDYDQQQQSEETSEVDVTIITKVINDNGGIAEPEDLDTRLHPKMKMYSGLIQQNLAVLRLKLSLNWRAIDQQIGEITG